MDSTGIGSTSAFQNAVGNATAKAVEKVVPAESVSANRAGKDDEKDQLDLSSSSLLELLDKIDLFGAKPRADGLVHIEDVRANYAESFDRFTQKLSGLLERAGIDRGCEAILRSDGEGKIRVANNHPDREKIEALFEQNPELANEFRGLSGTASFLRAADEHSKFAAAYDKDPVAAVQQFSYLFDKTDSREFAMRVTNDSIMGFFE